jgi:predicted DNA-binding transcriptional regulator YafY
MPKRPDGIETLLLSLELLHRIPRKPRYATASALHAQLTEAGIKRDLRTIQRQLDLLSQHFDLERDDRSKPYRYRWKEHAKALAVPMLNNQESLLLMLAEQHLRNLLPVKLMKSMESFFVQARSKLDAADADKYAREWPRKVRVVRETQPLLPPPLVSGVFAAVTEALYSNLWLDIKYKNAAGKVSDVHVMPLGLAQQGPRMYLVCRFRGYDNERTLALHRMVSASASTLTFNRPRSFSLEKFDDEGRFGMGNGVLVRLEFRITHEAGKHLLESPLSADQTVSVEGEFMLVRATVMDTRQLEWWLRGFGWQIKEVSRIPLPAVIPRGRSA